MTAAKSGVNTKGARSRFRQTWEFPDWEPDDCAGFISRRAEQDGIALNDIQRQILRDGFELMEVARNGVARDQPRRLATKMLPTEDEAASALRAVRAELCVGETERIELLARSVVKWEEVTDSARFPGLSTHYKFLQLSAIITGLPAGEGFDTIDAAKGFTRSWKWQRVANAENVQSKE